MVCPAFFVLAIPSGFCHGKAVRIIFFFHGVVGKEERLQRETPARGSELLLKACRSCRRPRFPLHFFPHCGNRRYFITPYKPVRGPQAARIKIDFVPCTLYNIGMYRISTRRKSAPSQGAGFLFCSQLQSCYFQKRRTSTPQNAAAASSIISCSVFTAVSPECLRFLFQSRPRLGRGIFVLARSE